MTDTLDVGTHVRITADVFAGMTGIVVHNGYATPPIGSMLVKIDDRDNFMVALFPNECEVIE